MKEMVAVITRKATRWDGMVPRISIEGAWRYARYVRLV